MGAPGPFDSGARPAYTRIAIGKPWVLTADSAQECDQFWANYNPAADCPPTRKVETRTSTTTPARPQALHNYAAFARGDVKRMRG